MHIDSYVNVVSCFSLYEKQSYFISFGIIESILLVILKIEYRLSWMGKGGGGGGVGLVCSLANYSVAYEETQSNQVSDFFFFCDFVCSLFPKAILFHFCLRLHIPQK